MTDNLHGLALTPPSTANANNAHAGNDNPAPPPANPAPNRRRAPAPAAAPGPATTPAPGPATAPAPDPAPATAVPTQGANTLSAQTAAAYEARLTALTIALSAYRNIGNVVVPKDLAPGQEAVAALEAPSLKESPRKIVLPAIVPGHKANALDNGESHSSLPYLCIRRAPHSPPCRVPYPLPFSCCCTASVPRRFFPACLPSSYPFSMC